MDGCTYNHIVSLLFVARFSLFLKFLFISNIPSTFVILKLGRKKEMSPCIDRIWGPLMIRWSRMLKKRPHNAREVQTVKKWEMVRLASPKYWEIEKAKTCAFRRQSGFYHFCWISSDWLVESVSAQS